MEIRTSLVLFTSVYIFAFYFEMEINEKTCRLFSYNKLGKIFSENKDVGVSEGFKASKRIVPLETKSQFKN